MALGAWILLFAGSGAGLVTGKAACLAVSAEPRARVTPQAEPRAVVVASAEPRARLTVSAGEC